MCLRDVEWIARMGRMGGLCQMRFGLSYSAAGLKILNSVLGFAQFVSSWMECFRRLSQELCTHGHYKLKDMVMVLDTTLRTLFITLWTLFITDVIFHCLISEPVFLDNSSTSEMFISS